jgi:hypothetical protein
MVGPGVIMRGDPMISYGGPRMLCRQAQAQAEMEAMMGVMCCGGGGRGDGGRRAEMEAMAMMGGPGMGMGGRRGGIGVRQAAEMEAMMMGGMDPRIEDRRGGCIGPQMGSMYPQLDGFSMGWEDVDDDEYLRC